MANTPDTSVEIAPSGSAAEEANDATASDSLLVHKEVSRRTLSYHERPGVCWAVLAMASVAYFGKYFAISDLYIVETLFEGELFISPSRLSIILAISYAASIFGKVTAGVLSDARGGKFVFVLAGLGYVVTSILFGLLVYTNPTPVAYPRDPKHPHQTVLAAPGWQFALFLIVWAYNGYFALGLCWVSVVALCTNWVPTAHYGTLMGLVSMAPQLGDVIARSVLSSIIIVFPWRTIFFWAAGFALCLMLPVVFFVKNAPGEEETAIQKTKTKEEREPFRQRAIVLLKHPNLWLLALLSGCLYSVRTLFLLYSPSLLVHSFCANKGNRQLVPHNCLTSHVAAATAGRASALFTLLGCVSTLVIGRLRDWLPKRHRASVLLLPLFVLLVCLGLLWNASNPMWKHSNGGTVSFGVAVTSLAVAGLMLFGPYKMIGAVFAPEIGGKRLKGTACSIMGISDNTAAMVLLLVKGWIGGNWHLMFSILAIITCVAIVCALCLWANDISSSRDPHAHLRAITPSSDLYHRVPTENESTQTDEETGEESVAQDAGMADYRRISESRRAIFRKISQELDV
ncbi:unnamed protein product [Vitrella brassicaformis CCMP3155]|uniref:Major facilitator superfamily (MFS) profile domain-containing protein n=3 Tax=Vitrella brassicaformis TaxID=1169539 RepID=A0A0G4G3B5_VITBC|nr:unnamed protein product [Vitrella brassicaformis CCMP3155]|eukprot:CEM22746.1 unnamed protein product [Vitrella brassicaformis CCMP3155]